MAAATDTFDNDATKPLLRGWLHAGASVVAAAAVPWLLGEARDDPARLAALTLFGLTMVLLYAVSAAYHIGEWRAPVRRLLARLDYANIFLFIAASCTVVSVLAAPDGSSLVRLAPLWALGVAGIACVFVLPCLRRRVRTALYVLMGWAGVALATPVLHAGLQAPALAVLGGSAGTYLVGAAVYAWRRPDPLPAVFGFHELFHLLTIVANTALGAAIWLAD